MIVITQQLLLQLQPGFGWHESSLGWCIFLLELVRHLLHCYKLDTLVLHEVFNEPAV
jgi:hypothetical protein